jgi:hypothetical protein
MGNSPKNLKLYNNPQKQKPTTPQKNLPQKRKNSPNKAFRAVVSMR